MKDLTPIHSPPQPLAAQDLEFVGSPDEFGDPASPVRIKRFLSFPAQTLVGSPSLRYC